jgi:hypothetical protein
MPNCLLYETRTKVVDLNLPICTKLRVPPTIFDVLAEEKPQNQSWSDFLLSHAITGILTKHNMVGNWRHSNRLVVRMFGENPHRRRDEDTGAGTPYETAVGGHRR